MPTFSIIATLLSNIGRRWPFKRGRSLLERVFSIFASEDPSYKEISLKESSVIISVPLNDSSARRLILFGEDDKNLFCFLMQVQSKSKGIFLDVGAHFGEYSLRIAKNTNSHVIAIEPQPVLAKLLHANAAKNGVDNLIEIHSVVAGSKKEDVAFFESSQDSSTSKVEPDNEGLIIRPMIPLSKLIPVETWKKVSLVKIDVEGYEQEVLLGLLTHLKKHAPLVVFEANTNELTQRGFSLDTVISILKEAGYYEFFFIREGLQPFSNDSLLLLDNIVAKSHTCVFDLAF